MKLSRDRVTRSDRMFLGRMRPLPEDAARPASGGNETDPCVFPHRRECGTAVSSGEGAEGH
jgi:hypothetical protein